MPFGAGLLALGYVKHISPGKTFRFHYLKHTGGGDRQGRCLFCGIIPGTRGCCDSHVKAVLRVRAALTLDLCRYAGVRQLQGTKTHNFMTPGQLPELRCRANTTHTSHL